MEQSKTAASVASVCRLCFMEREQLELIFDNDNGYLCQWIEKLTSLKIIQVPNAPASLCSNCKSTLEAFDSFREMCINNDHVFKDTFCGENSNPVKFDSISIKMECDTDQETENDSAEVENSLIKCERPERQGEGNDVQTEQSMLVDEVPDGGIKTEFEIEENENVTYHDATELTVAEDTLKVQCHNVDRNLKINEQSMEKVDENVQDEVQDGPDARGNEYECKVCNSKKRCMTHKAGLFNAKAKDSPKIKMSSSNSSATSEVSFSKWNKKEHQRKLFTVYGGRYECGTCKKYVSKLHSMTHKAKELFTCYICKKKFRKFEGVSRHFQNHVRKNHVADDKKKNETISCDDNQTKKEIASGSKESKTSIKYGGPREIRNSPIPTKSDDDSDEEHIAVQNDREFKCKICKTYVSELHAISHKTEGYQCPVCGDEFNRFDCFSRHVRSHKNKGKFVCGVCNAGFSCTYRLKRHKKLQHSNQ